MKISGADLLVRTLIELESRHVFNVPGFGMQPFIEAIDRRRHELDYVTSVNETNIGLIAHGYASASGRPAFLNVYHASGSALAMIAMTTAWAERVPLVLTTTTTARAVSARDPYAAAPRAITEMSEQFAKWTFEVPSAERIPEAVARAFEIARAQPAGPVHLAFPADLYTQVVDDPGSVALLATPLRSTADPELVLQALTLIQGSRDPVLVLGAEVARADAVEQALALAHGIGATVLTEPYLSRLPYPTTDPQFAGSISDNASAIAAADLVIVAGCELTERFTRLDALAASNAKRIAISADAENLIKHEFGADAALLGDLRLVLGSLAAVLEREPEERDDSRSELVRQRRDDALAIRSSIRARSTGGRKYVNAGDLVAVLASKTRGWTIVNQAGGSAVYLDMLYDFDDPSLYFGLSAKASAQGWAVPAAIGIQLAYPDRPAVVFVGDGGFMFSATAIYTAAKRKAKILFVVVNNGGWIDIGESSRKQGGTSHEHEDEFGWTFRDPAVDFAGFARSLGLESGRCASVAELERELTRLISVDGPALLEVISDPADVTLHFERIA